MKGIMFNEKYGLESAVLNGSKTRTWRADKKTRYEVGEVVAIKQSYCRVLSENRKSLFNKIDMNVFVNEIQLSAGWRNKMFTKNELMPHKIRITAVKKCRLQDLTDEECLKEGIYRAKNDIGIYTYTYTNNKLGGYSRPIGAFRDLIRTLNGNGYWESNPDGYAYEFELVK